MIYFEVFRDCGIVSVEEIRIHKEEGAIEIEALIGSSVFLGQLNELREAFGDDDIHVFTNDGEKLRIIITIPA